MRLYLVRRSCGHAVPVRALSALALALTLHLTLRTEPCPLCTLPR